MMIQNDSEHTKEITVSDCEIKPNHQNDEKVSYHKPIRTEEEERAIKEKREKLDLAYYRGIRGFEILMTVNAYVWGTIWSALSIYFIVTRTWLLFLPITLTFGIGFWALLFGERIADSKFVQKISAFLRGK